MPKERTHTSKEKTSGRKREAERTMQQNGQGSLGYYKRIQQSKSRYPWDSAKRKAEYRDKMFGEKADLCRSGERKNSAQESNSCTKQISYEKQ